MRYEEEIKRLGEEEYPEAKRLQQIDAVGPIISLAFVLTVEDPWRFRKARNVGAFLGMVPKVERCRKQERQLGITKAGDPYLRKLLVQCAPHILGPYGRLSDLRWWGLKLVARGGGKAGKRKAVVAVARRVAVLMLVLWCSGEEYIPLGNTIGARKREGEACNGPPENGENGPPAGGEGKGADSCSMPGRTMVETVGQRKVGRRKRS